MTGDALSNLRPRQIRAVHALLEEATIARAAERAGVNEKTVRRWLADAAFRRALDHVRREVFAGALARLQSGAGRAVDALLGVLGDPHSRPSDRLSAARSLLEHAHRAQDSLDVQRTIGDLLDRTAALEADLRGEMGYPN